MNKNVRRTRDLMDKLDVIRREARTAPGRERNAASLDALAEWCDELIDVGEGHRAFWVDAVHGDFPRVAADARESKRAWLRWVAASLRTTTFVGMPVKAQNAIMDVRDTSDRWAQWANEH